MDLANTPATLVLILATLFVSLYALVGNRQFLAAYSFNIDALIQRREHYRVFTASFLHVDPAHLMINLMALMLIGPGLENALGADGLMAVYFGAVLASGIAAFYSNRHNPSYSSLGASDALSGLVIAYCLFFPLREVHFWFVPLGVPAIVFGGLYLFAAVRQLRETGPKLAPQGFVAGMVTGLGLSILLRPDLPTALFV